MATTTEILPPRRSQIPIPPAPTAVGHRRRQDNDVGSIATNGSIHHDVPKAPDNIWWKKLSGLDRRKRPRPETQAVSPMLRADARAQAASIGPTPTRHSTTDEIERNDVVQPSTSSATVDGSDNNKKTVQNGLQVTDRQNAVRDGSIPTERRPYISLAPSTQPLLRTAVEPLYLSDIDEGTPSPALIRAEPITKVVSREQKRKDIRNLVHRNPEKEQYALNHVYMTVEHYMKDSERTLNALLIEMEDHNGSRRISVTCYGLSGTKAREIDAVLSKTGKGLQGYSFIVRRKKGAGTFGFKGSESDHTYQPFPASDRVHVGNVYHNFVHSNGRGHNGSDDGQRSKTDRPYADTIYWTPQSTMVEGLCADQPRGNMAATPIRVQIRGDNGLSLAHTWTCGGIINVNGTHYGLTTAHPYVLSDSVRTSNLSRTRRPSDSTDISGRSFADDGLPEIDADFYSVDDHLESYWQSIGKVSHYALAKIGFYPRNHDWLLIDLPEDRIMWNAFRGTIVSDENVLTVHTARAVLTATLLEGSAYLILGDSPFEVLKFQLEAPLRKHANVQYSETLYSL